MTRIIGGVARSLTLVVPDAGTRPTSDRVRESLFGALETSDDLAELVVLDLYAGSGALGLEALSRGASHASFVEKSAPAAQVIERNISIVRTAIPTLSTSVHRQSADMFLRGAGRPFDLVFIDPPYGLADEELTQTLALLAPRLAPEALVLIERGTRATDPVLPVGLEVERTKKYGDTVIWWARRR